MIRSIALLVAFLGILSSAASGETFTIATYNLNWGNRRGDQILDAVSEADADLICFQETTPVSETFLKERLAKTYPHFHSVGHQGKYLGERFVFASKTSLANTRYVGPATGLFGFFSASIPIAGESVHIVNVHLTPFQVQRGGGITDAMTAVSATEQIHSSEVTAIIQSLDIKKPTIVIGDFNSLSSFNAPNRLVELGFIDSFASVITDADTHPTWHWPTRPLPLALRIDYIFHTPHFETIKSEIIKRDGSDHSLVVSELRRTDVGDAR
ncbi:endonuclease/exonuclease/phosphatase family protein [Novipirellula artificiosorum]|uniref:Endonuclease/Exonuclease/phosphatase family protein n=1 Tax=Novipirellula artificiosorum TaxID=2528016 RepID=A0A5C6DRC1_9BACT|nr:endonuclease/exonuclease/phosphatase family protein [Novipirellula artificiosorum]TWU39390.1 Endonuclease/Exonuclease/phosphatase family protein [Novipirellula artificiosorum]